VDWPWVRSWPQAAAVAVMVAGGSAPVKEAPAPALARAASRRGAAAALARVACLRGAAPALARAASRRGAAAALARGACRTEAVAALAREACRREAAAASRLARAVWSEVLAATWERRWMAARMESCARPGLTPSTASFVRATSRRAADDPVRRSTVPSTLRPRNVKPSALEPVAVNASVLLATSTSGAPRSKISPAGPPAPT
jgi:hypothetical protein